ncbi:MAG: zinc-binding alcohol dehydrogenase [Lentisphaerae bacterium]|nr:zinc-binding alcohol dehydrogenase [Lentisphaerota bacterium]
MTGRQIVFPERGRAVVEEVAVPAPGPDEVLLESDYSVISAGTERANLMQLPNTVTAERGFPHHPGYSAAGRVVAIGAGVRDLAVGDRALITWGGHRSHTIRKASGLTRVDEGIDSLDAAFAHIASFPMLGVRVLHLELGESALIMGMGILGAFAVQLARLCGAEPVLVADPDPVRRDLALRLGASAALAPDAPAFAEQVKAASGGSGPNAVVEVTGAALALQQALDVIAFEGRVALLGCTRRSDVPIDFYQKVHRRGVALIGAHTMARPKHESRPGRWTESDDYRTFLRLVAAGRLEIRPLISAVVPPEDAPAVYQRLAEEAHPPLGIVFDWRSAR